MSEAAAPVRGSRRGAWRGRTPEAVLAFVVVAAIVYVVVRVVVPTPRETVRIDGFEPAQRSSTVLVAFIGHDTCTSDFEGSAVEYREVVIVTVKARVDDGNCDSVGLTTTVEIQLDLPLGSRAVLDSTCAVSLDERTPCVLPAFFADDTAA